MPDSRSILVAVDFSACSKAALLWAATTADGLGVPLIILHVVHDPEAAPGYYARSGNLDHVRSMKEVAERLFADFMEATQADHGDLAALGAARTELVVGLPATRIIEVADRENVQQIVVGSQGRTGLRHLMIGSKAARVAQLSTVPVTIVKAADETSA